jgi:hypothetical protein
MINFFSGKKEYRSLSNFWEGEVRVNGRVYPTGEHCFHGEKYTLLGERSDEPRRKELLDYGRTFTESSPAVAKRRGGKRGLCLTSEELAIWSDLSIEVQRSICKWKRDTYEEVRHDLEKSGTHVLIHPALRCSLDKVSTRVWEGKGVIEDGKVVVLGQNRLGNLWMELR